MKKKSTARSSGKTGSGGAGSGRTGKGAPKAGARPKPPSRGGSKPVKPSKKASGQRGAARAVATRPAAKKAPSRKNAGKLVIEVQESSEASSASAQAIPAPFRGKAPARPAGLSGEEFAVEAARMMHDDKCTDVVVIDVRGRSPMADFLVIGSGTSDRQMKSVLLHLEELGSKLKFPTRRVNQDERATWLLADFFDVVAHLFEPNTRAHYDLEMLWGDAPRLAWERPDQVNRDRAGLNAG